MTHFSDLSVRHLISLFILESFFRPDLPQSDLTPASDTFTVQSQVNLQDPGLHKCRESLGVCREKGQFYFDRESSYAAQHQANDEYKDPGFYLFA